MKTKPDQRLRLVLAISCCAISGVMGLVGGSMAFIVPRTDAQAAGVILLPFDEIHALRRIAATGLPIVDIRLGGRLVILRFAPETGSISLLKAAGLVVIAAEAPEGCTWTAKET